MDNKLKFGYVPELTVPNAFDKLFDKAYDFIIHTASPVAFVVKDVKAGLIAKRAGSNVSLCYLRPLKLKSSVLGLSDPSKVRIS